MAGVSRETIQKLTEKGIIPKAGRNRYELRNALPILFSYLWRSRCRSYVFRNVKNVPFSFGAWDWKESEEIELNVKEWLREEGE